MSIETTIIVKTVGTSLFQTLGGAGKRRSCLILYSGNESGKRYVLDAPTMTVGRLADTEIFIDNTSVSRRHAELTITGEAVTVHDLGSSNGTHVNELRIAKPTVLRDGDILRMGRVLFKFYERESLDALLHDRIYRMATVDGGTECFNRQYLIDHLGSEIKLARLTRRPLSVIYYDLDFFKGVNDRFGHSGGDQVLKESTAVVKAVLREDDILGRLGGEEFIVVLPNTAVDEAAALAERIRAALAGHVFMLEREGPQGKETVPHRQTVSLGVAQLEDSMPEARQIIDAADRQLYRSKHTGRNKVSC